MSSVMLSAMPNCSVLLEKKGNINTYIYLKHNDEWKREELEVIFRLFRAVYHICKNSA